MSFHRVRAEERLSQIAALHGVPYQDIVAANQHKPLVQLQSGAVVFASLAAGEDIALPAMLGADPTPEAISACASDGGVASYGVPDPNTPDQPASWSLTCVSGKTCTGGAERDTACQSCPTNAYASGSTCICYEGFTPFTVPVFSMPGGGWGGGGGVTTSDALVACIPPGEPPPPPTPTGPYAGDVCTDAYGYAGTYQEQPASAGGFPGGLVCVQPSQQSAYPGDSCTTPEGNAGEYDGYLTCVAYPPKSGDRCTTSNGSAGMLVESGPPAQWGGPPPLMCQATVMGTYVKPGDACTTSDGKPGTYDPFMDCVSTAPKKPRIIVEPLKPDLLKPGLFVRPGMLKWPPTENKTGDACTTATGHAGTIDVHQTCVSNAQDRAPKPGDACTMPGTSRPGHLDQHLICVPKDISEAQPHKPKPGAPCTTKLGTPGIRNAKLLCVAKTIPGQQAGEGGDTTPAEGSSKLPWILGGLALVAAIGGGAYLYKTSAGAKPAKAPAGKAKRAANPTGRRPAAAAPASPRHLRPGAVAYVPYTDEVERVIIVERGDGGRNFKAGYRPHDPYVVRNDEGEWVVGAAQLYADPLAASIESANMAAD